MMETLQVLTHTLNMLHLNGLNSCKLLSTALGPLAFKSFENGSEAFSPWLASQSKQSQGA